MALAGDGCDSFSDLFDIIEQALLTWNPILGVDGANCGTLFWEGEYYCVGVSGSSTATSITPTVMPTGVATPSLVQAGIDSQCTKYAEALSGTYCSLFASDNDITLAQLYTWNPILGTNGANCGTLFYANTYYCIGAPSAAATTTTAKAATTTSVTAPGPTQTGITAACNKFAEVVSGDGCSIFASEHGITTTQLCTWNPVLGGGGANCGTLLWLNEYYCVGVSS